MTRGKGFNTYKTDLKGQLKTLYRGHRGSGQVIQNNREPVTLFPTKQPYVLRALEQINEESPTIPPSDMSMAYITQQSSNNSQNNNESMRTRRASPINNPKLNFANKVGAKSLNGIRYYS